MTSPSFERLPSVSLRGRIAETLREAILNGSLTEGQRLVERNLAAQLGASLTAVREALIELEMDGFIQKRRNASTFVTKLSIEDTVKIFAVRSVLEKYAAEQAARLAGPEQIAHLEAIYSEMETAARAHDGKLLVLKDYSWHQALWQISENDYLQAMLRRLVVPVFAFTTMRVINRQDFEPLRDAQAHLPILEAIKAHDPATAGEALVTALAEWADLIRSYVFGANEVASAG